MGCRHKEIISPAIPLVPAIVISQQMPGSKDAFGEDTMIIRDYGSVNVKFNSNKAYDSYEWKIAVDPRFSAIRESSLSLDFYVGDYVDTRLIGKARTGQGTSPLDTTTVTLYKTFYLFHQKTIPYAFEGTFTGYNVDSPNHRFEIRFVDYGSRPRDANGNYVDGYYDMRILGLPRGCEASITMPDPKVFAPEVACTYTHFEVDYIDIGDGCYPMMVKGMLIRHKTT